MSCLLFVFSKTNEIVFNFFWFLIKLEDSVFYNFLTFFEDRHMEY